MKSIGSAIAVLLIALLPAVAHAHGGHSGGHAFGASGDPRSVAFGRPGDPAKVSRTIEVRMDDQRCRLQQEVRLRQGDTVRFDVRNDGTRMHEFVIGTSHELARHAGEPSESVGADHDEPFILHVEPGSRGSLVWRFTRVDLLGYGCLLHGTGETKMSGRIIVER